jgi:AraC-like DNA-binding protein
MQMDVKVYASIVNLVLISREDLKRNGIPVSKDIQEILVQIRQYYEKQISLGHAPPITEVAEHFEISIQQLRLTYKAIYGHNLQSYITKMRMEMAADLLLNTNKLISIIAYDTGYHLKVFQKQFKSYYGLSPSEYRRLYKK